MIESVARGGDSGATRWCNEHRRVLARVQSQKGARAPRPLPGGSGPFVRDLPAPGRGWGRAEDEGCVERRRAGHSARFLWVGYLPGPPASRMPLRARPPPDRACTERARASTTRVPHCHSLACGAQRRDARGARRARRAALRSGSNASTRTRVGGARSRRRAARRAHAARSSRLVWLELARTACTSRRSGAPPRRTRARSPRARRNARRALRCARTA